MTNTMKNTLTFSIIMQVCFNCTIIKFYFSFHIFFVKDWFTVIYLFNIVATFTLHIIASFRDIKTERQTSFNVFVLFLLYPICLFIQFYALSKYYMHSGNFFIILGTNKVFISLFTKRSLFRHQHFISVYVINSIWIFRFGAFKFINCIIWNIKTSLMMFYTICNKNEFFRMQFFLCFNSFFIFF